MVGSRYVFAPRFCCHGRRAKPGGRGSSGFGRALVGRFVCLCLLDYVEFEVVVFPSYSGSAVDSSFYGDF